MEERIAELIASLTAAGISAERAGSDIWIPDDDEVHAMVGVDRWVQGGEAVARITVYGPRSKGCADCDAGSQAVAAILGAGANVTGGVYDPDLDCFLGTVTWTWPAETSGPSEDSAQSLAMFAKCGSTVLSGVTKVDIAETRERTPQFSLGSSKPIGWVDGPVCYQITITQENPDDYLDGDGCSLQLLSDGKMMYFDNCIWREIEWQRTKDGQRRMSKAISYSKTEERVTENAV